MSSLASGNVAQESLLGDLALEAMVAPCVRDAPQFKQFKHCKSAGAIGGGGQPVIWLSV